MVCLWLYFEANKIFCGRLEKKIRQGMMEFPYKMGQQLVE